MNYQKELGHKGEAIATRFFENRGYCVLDKNYHAFGGEIDLILKKNSEYIFVEVKTRRSQSFGVIQESIPPQKIKKILKAVEAYFLKKLGFDEIPNFRLDAFLLRFQNEKIFYEHLKNISLEDF